MQWVGTSGFNLNDVIQRMHGKSKSIVMQMVTASSRFAIDLLIAHSSGICEGPQILRQSRFNVDFSATESGYCAAVHNVLPSGQKMTGDAA